MTSKPVVACISLICTRTLAFVAFCAPFLFIDSPVFSQTAATPASPAVRPTAQPLTPAPASRQQVQAYLQQAGLSICFLVKKNVDYKTALSANTSAVMLLLKDKHGNRLDSSPASFDPAKFAPGLSFDITVNAINSCPSVIPKQIRDEAQSLSLKIRQSIKNNAANGNGQ
jgi:hypothetical protein